MKKQRQKRQRGPKSLEALRRLLSGQLRDLRKDTPEEFTGRMPTDILTLIRFDDGHVHGVYPDSDDTAMEMLPTAIDEFALDGLDYQEEADVELPSKIVFHNRQAIGDILMFTCAVRDFCRTFPEIEVAVESTAMHLWDYNPYVYKGPRWNDTIDPMTFWKSGGKPNDQQRLDLNKTAVEKAVQENRPVKVNIGSGRGTNQSNRLSNHFANAYRISIEASLGVRIEQGPIRPDIYMTKEELREEPLVEPPYWLITAGEKGDWTAKTWGIPRWQEIITALPSIKFVQLGVKSKKGHIHKELTGPNVVNFVGETQGRDDGIRRLMNLFCHCDGSIGLVSFHMHLCAAFGKPCVVIAGAREPVWFTRYPGHQYLAVDGCIPCTVTGRGESTACWKCDLNGCPHKVVTEDGQDLPLCTDMIGADDVVRAILKYYKGKRLDKTKASGPSKLINVVDVPKELTPLHVVEEAKAEGIPKEWNMEWGGGSITDRDWAFMKSIIEREKVKTVLEIGAGLSTLLFNRMGLKVITFETDQRWISTVKKINPDLDIRTWSSTEFPNLDDMPDFDLAFVDGPAGGENREISTKLGAELSDLVIVHDAGREWERKWQAKYLEPGFDLDSKGGHRCHYWKRRPEGAKVVEPPRPVCERVETEEVEVIDPTAKTVRVVFNGRGDGGAEHSTTWLMNTFRAQGYQVEYLSPSGNPSGTFKRDGDPHIPIYNFFEFVGAEADLMVLYVNDWVWDFTKPEVAKVFERLKAKRKVMVVNYRMGKIGREPWTLGWNKYMFLNSSLEADFKKIAVGGYYSESVNMAPPTDLSPYLLNSPNYGGNLRLVRHNSQGDTKYPKNFNEMVTQVLDEFPDAEIHLMPAPTFLDDFGDRVKTYQRNVPAVQEFLMNGNCFWYPLPEGYHDQGPKVIMEAQASGLPVIADNHSGAKDRVVEGTGYLCDTFDDHIAAMKDLSTNVIRLTTGSLARAHAHAAYSPQRWIEEILG